MLTCSYTLMRDRFAHQERNDPMAGLRQALPRATLSADADRMSGDAASAMFCVRRARVARRFNNIGGTSATATLQTTSVLTSTKSPAHMDRRPSGCPPSSSAAVLSGILTCVASLVRLVLQFTPRKPVTVIVGRSANDADIMVV